MNVGKLAQVRAFISATRHGNPGKDLNVVLIAGEYGKATVATLFTSVAKQAGKSVLRVSTRTHKRLDASMDDFFQTLVTVKKDKPDFVVIEATDELVALGVLSQVEIGTLVFTGPYEKAAQLLRESPRHVVAPAGLDVPAELIEPYKHISYGDDEAAEAKLTAVRLFKKGTEVDVLIDHQIKLTLATYLVGYANAWDVLIVASMAYVLGFDTDLIQEGIAEVEAMDGSFVLQDDKNLYLTFYDIGTHDASVERAVASAKELARRRLIVAVTFTSVSDEAVEAVRAKADRVFVVAVSDRTLPHDVDRALTTDDAIEKARRAAKSGDVVLILGADAPTAEESGQ